MFQQGVLTWLLLAKIFAIARFWKCESGRRLLLWLMIYVHSVYSIDIKIVEP